LAENKTFMEIFYLENSKWRNNLIFSKKINLDFVRHLVFSELNPRTSERWIQKPYSHTIGSQIVFSQNPNFEDRRLKNGKNIGHRQTECKNSIEHII
jgi:hypothetical protein